MESSLHRSMKSIVRHELEREQYRLVEEPAFPPSSRISWETYRPDLLGFRVDSQIEEVVIVECETHPCMNRFRSKKYSSLWFQPSLLRDGRIRRILAVPGGRFHVVDLRLRHQWEIWVLGASGPLEKISSLSNVPHDSRSLLATAEAASSGG